MISSSKFKMQNAKSPARNRYTQALAGGQLKVQKFLNYKFLLVLLLVFGFLIRVWGVDSYPPLLWDEASLGYNAYSILKTGRDEHGAFLPMVFKSFGDYKPGFYVYLVIPFIETLGLNELSVRLPSIILGSLTPLVLYLLVKQIFDDDKLGLVSAVILAFLPWHIHFSRGAWEVNVMVFWLALGSWLVIRKLKIQSSNVKAIAQNSKLIRLLNLWTIALFPFLLALWTYQGAKMLVPLIILGLVLFVFCDNITVKQYSNSVAKWLYSHIVILLKMSLIEKVGTVVVIGLMALWYLQTFSGQAANRLKVMSLFSFRQPVNEIQQILNEDQTVSSNFHTLMFHGEWLFFKRGFLNRYFNYFSSRFLAFEGDWTNARHSAPYIGIVGHMNFILFILGLSLFFMKKHKLGEYFFFYWLLTAPIPAALSRDIISGVRALPMVIPIVFFIGYGIEQILNFKFQISDFLKRLIIVSMLFLTVIDFIYWLDLYFTHMVRRSPKDWLYGYRESINFVLENKTYSKNIIFTDFYGQPYIYYLFYSRYDPVGYQREGYLTENIYSDVGQVKETENTRFKPVDWRAESSLPSAILVLSQDEIFRQNLDKDQTVMSKLIPLGIINNQATFYGYKKD